MQQRHKYIYIAVLLCCAVLITATSASTEQDISDASSTGQQQPLKKLRFADFFDSSEDTADDYGRVEYSNFSDDLTDITNAKVAPDAHDNHWDVLIFTQQWPVTTCYHWRQQDPSHECTLPQQKEFWTIHGIWPTKMGQIGPNFCNNSADFDVNQLSAITELLNTYWPDLERGSGTLDALWKHEWLKHGTCAALLDELNSELKYFSHGLAWRDSYIMSRILDAANIHPDSNHTVTALNNAIVKSIGKNPSIHCLFDAKHNISYLAEIRICFNKSLQLIDCDGVKRGDAVSIKYLGGTVTTNCHISKLVHYPSLVPPLQRKQQWKFPLVNVYKLLQFLMWFTL